MLGRGPSGGGRGTEYQGRTLEPSTASNHPDSSRLLLSAPPLSKEGSDVFIECGSATGNKVF